jgi:dihydroxyacid dehydratase/phosphogluconate dehydratase
MAGFLIKALVATMALAIIFVGWFSFTIAGNASNNQVVQQMGNACFPGGLCTSVFAAQMMGMFELAMGIALLVVFLYLALATNQEEPTAIEYGAY